jgi:PiT family inorganic phosphate transporter
VEVFGDTLSTAGGLFLLLALLLALGFEFVNGFHDTANAVATVIYTHTLKPTVAVVWSGCWNLLGVLASSGAVAFGVIALLPVELVIDAGSSAGFAMVFALLISAIIWNLGTWYLGLPASSSHTMVGSIMGVGLGNSLLAQGRVFGEGVNWAKAQDVGTSLLISPLIGFCGAALLLLLSKAVLKRPDLYRAPEGDKPPPPWIRGLLILTCTGVSFAHGSNDGQKGMGLIMLILIGILPGAHALNLGTRSEDIVWLAMNSRSVAAVLDRKCPGPRPDTGQATDDLSAFLKQKAAADCKAMSALSVKSGAVAERLEGKHSFLELTSDQRRDLRADIYLMTETLRRMIDAKQFADPNEKVLLNEDRERLEHATKFIPGWVKVSVALALGLGTMIGWKRIVVTVGEKIGKEHLTYAQGASAEVVAMLTIGVSDIYGLPVSTTHVLSSGVAGAMAANRSGIQMDTLRSLLLAWVLTLPACVFLGATTFAACLYVVLHIAGL